MNRVKSVVAAAIALALLAASCSSTGGEIVAGPGDLGHIHDLAIDEDETLFAAAHTGLYRIEGINRAVLIGSERHDLMSMAMTDTGDLLASGHPDLREESYRVEGKLPFLGLARSSDDGQTWTVESLLGDADFHALVPHSDGLFAAETSGQIWVLDATEGWTVLGDVEARDLAVDPIDSDRQLAAGYDSGVWFSQDRAGTWEQSPDAPPLIEIEWITADLIIGVTESGTFWSTRDPSGPWTRIASGPTDVETFFVDATDRWWLTTHGGAISRSDDTGSTWSAIYVPPSN